MKKIVSLFPLIVLLMLAACQPVVTFTEPQPANTENVPSFPNRLQGNYLSTENSSMLLISDKIITRVYDYDAKVHTNQLDSNMQLRGDTLVDLKTKEKMPVKFEGDSLITHMHYTDTLFVLNNENVMRKLKGYYFLNTKYGPDSWEVKKLHLLRGKLTISRINSAADIANLLEYAENNEDTVPPYKVTITKKQFRKFVRKNGFTNDEVFVRQKK